MSNRPSRDTPTTTTTSGRRNARQSCTSDSVAFGLAIIEMSENVELRYINGKYVRESDYKPSKASRRYAILSWTTTKDIPCGRLRLLVLCPVSWCVLVDFIPGEQKPNAHDGHPRYRAVSRELHWIATKKVKEEQRQAEIRHLSAMGGTAGAAKAGGRQDQCRASAARIHRKEPPAAS